MSRLKVLSSLYALILILSLGALSFPPAKTADAADLHVGSGQTYATIQAAVNAANPAGGDTIIVHSGNYTENISITKSCTIQSESGFDTTFVHTTGADKNGFGVSADNVTIDGFSVYGATEAGWAGIYLESGTSQCTIINNRCGWDSSHNNFDGIRVYKSNNNTISSNICNNNIRAGILSDANNSAYNSISQNTCNNGRYGIWLLNSNSNTVYSNICNANEDNGIFLDNCSSNIIYLNSLNDNSLNNVKSNNTCSNNWNSSAPLNYSFNGVPYTGYMGNYYDDYSGVDADGNGIGDSAYTIDNDSDEEYPLFLLVSPDTGSTSGGTTVTITSNNRAPLGNGSDITSVTLKGVVASITGQTETSVTVTSGTGTAGIGEAVVSSTSMGINSKNAGYTYVNAATYNITLASGWNLISLPIIPDNTDIDAVISNSNLASGNTDNIVMGYNYNTTDERWLWWNGTPSGTLNTMEDGKAYWIYATVNDVLTVHGTQAGHPGPDYEVFTGWNMIGFTSTSDMAVETYLASVDGNYSLLYCWIDGEWLTWTIAGSTFTNMVPGYGYWLSMSADGTITPA